jgi:hypothetical protein
MQPIQPPHQPTELDLASLKHIEQLLVKINEKLGFFVVLAILAIIWAFLT